ncbi:hypothetical protein MTR67_039753 [Solanum verrucosum]|uniref:SWIM-type domain-containing protein n=1 Tax=Solanum verrucosum TaxID=315347 RepID=A0AAF0ZQR1_SOLVR|nr:hypothetical protein MTR67_039753 [Solanum verrucosum]
MDTVIITRFHHGGKFIQDKNGTTYKGENEVEYVNINKDHFSIIELLFYTKQLGYITVGGFCVKDPTKNDFIKVETYFTLLNLIKDIKDGDFLDLYVKHMVDDVEVVTTTSLLCGPVVEKNSNVVGEEDLQDINVTASEGLNHEAESENVNVEVEPGDISDLEEEWAGSNQESSVDSQEDAIPDEDNSEADEELRSLRNERRNKVKKKKPIQTEEIKLGTAGIDRGFEDIGRNKAARYTGRLGGNEQYIDSSELDSDDSRDGLDPDFVRGVDLPARRKIKKGSCKGELLVVVSRNGNQQMFPIAWVVVDTETKHSWSFFLNYLIEDLNLGTRHGLTVMSDMQKGLVPALCELLPDSEQRRCARYIWSNWHQIWSGEERRNQFWRCVKSSFEDEMDKLNKLGNKICEDLLHYEKSTWCKAYFKEHSKCDIVENNMCETFNSWILAARHKAIRTMLEEIRHKIMDRNIAMRQFAETWISNISHMARLVLEENKDLARLCEVRFNGDIGYEILDGQYRHIVDIRKKTCTCRTWQLRGIPCQHVVLAYQHKGIEPEHEVVHWYRKETFLKAYNHFLQPIPNMKMWPHTSGVVIEPPEPKVMPGHQSAEERERMSLGKSMESCPKEE